MKKNGRIGQRLLLFSMAALIPPMTVFPVQFGTQLIRFSLAGLLYELVFYGVVIFAFQRRGGLLQLAPAALACLVYRVTLGLVLGLMITIAYGLNFKFAAMMGAFSYLPGVIFLAALTPFIMQPVAALFYRNFDRPQKRPVNEPAPVVAAPKTGRTSIAISRERGVVDKRPISRPGSEASRLTTAAATSSPTYSEVDGFDRAVRYLGEHGSVYMAAIVDHEGLLLANYVRGEVDAEEWAPLSLVFFQQNEEVLGRGHLESPEKLDLILKEKRIKVAREGNISLMVVSERHADDVLGIRVNQALEMIKKHMSERYSHMLDPNAERIHVSNTQ